MKLKLSENIRTLRTERGLTQSDLAVLLSVTPQAVSRWEQGQAYPDMETLPLLAKHLEVAIDCLMGTEDGSTRALKRELYERLRDRTADAAESVHNKRRILDICMRLAEAEPFYLRSYFRHLMSQDFRDALPPEEHEAHKSTARRMIRDRMYQSDMRERVELLHLVVSLEEEEMLPSWEDLYTMPPLTRVNLYDELLLSRYMRQNDRERQTAQVGAILYRQIENTLFYLTDALYHTDAFRDLTRHEAALSTLALYSTRPDDILIFSRIVTEARYAEALFMNGKGEEGLKMLALVTEHLEILHALPVGTVLSGSIPALAGVTHTLSEDDCYLRCIANIGGRTPDNRAVRDDPRFLAFEAILRDFLPKTQGRAWVNQNGTATLAPEWELLMRKGMARWERCAKDEDCLLLETRSGEIYTVTYRLADAIDPDFVIKTLIAMKRQCGVRVGRIVCLVGKNGGLDLPSYAFREALVDLDPVNLDAEMLLCGRNGFIVKPVRVTMPKSCGEKA